MGASWAGSLSLAPRKQHNLLRNLITILACTLALAACGANSGAPSTAATVHLDAGKALTLAYSGLDGAVLVVKTAVDTKAMSVADGKAATAKLVTAKATLDAADAAYHATATDPTAAISTVACLVSAARSLAGKPDAATGCPSTGS